MPRQLTAPQQCIQTSIRVFANRSEMGVAAGQRVENLLVETLKNQQCVRIVFAAAPSQNETIEYLVGCSTIEWKRVEAFHMDEYVGLGLGSSQSFNCYLRDRVFSKLPFKQVNYLNGLERSDEECPRYAGLLQASPIDLVLMGIGENGHIAFNDPHVADFNDPLAVKSVELDLQCRFQQVNDGCFESLEDVPLCALTLTIPTLMSATAIVCVVPGPTKAAAVQQMIYGPIDAKCPASILRKHPRYDCYFDVESAGSIL